MFFFSYLNPASYLNTVPSQSALISQEVLLENQVNLENIANLNSSLEGEIFLGKGENLTCGDLAFYDFMGGDFRTLSKL